MEEQIKQKADIDAENNRHVDTKDNMREREGGGRGGGER